MWQMYAALVKQQPVIDNKIPKYCNNDEEQLT